MSHYKPALVLILLATFVPEVITGSTPLSGYLNPVTALFLLVGYGLAVLVIREFAVRTNLNYAGIFLLGFAYAILNEGLIAKTMILNEYLPLIQYDGYAYAYGISFAWSAFISLWHAISSVLFPILVAHMLFPQESAVPWVGKKLAISLAAFMLILSSLSFFGAHRVSGTLQQFLTLVGAMLAFTLLSKRFKKGGAMTHGVQPPSTGSVWLGISTFLFIFIILSSIIAGQKLPAVLFFVTYLGGIWLYIYILKLKGWLDQKNLTLFVFGCYISTTIMGIILSSLLFVIPAMQVERVVTGTVALGMFIWFSSRITRGGTDY